jgi:menaquinone-specific isochorismate synthase
MTSLPAPADVGAPLVVRTVPLAADDLGALLSLLPPADAPELFSWVRRGEGMVGWGRALAHTAYGPERFAELRHWWADTASSAVVRNEVGSPGTGPVAFGSFAYAAGSPAGATLVVPRVLVGRRGDRAWLTLVSTGPELTAIGAPGVAPEPAPPQDVTFSDGATSPTRWAGAVARAVELITQDRLDKVVLARDLEVRMSSPVDARWVLRRLAERYDNTWVFSVDGLLGATPEMLVRSEKGLVTSRVLAGTIRRTGDDEHDLALAGSLARSSKDLEEHEYAVRSVADALGPHCSSMNVPETPFVLHLPNVMHLATDVTGVLVDGASSLLLAEALHPSAAVCGTPTAVADEVISELEGMDRGRYAGPVGWIDGSGDGEWGIALRCGWVDPEEPSRMRLFAGCGIVAGSDPEDEVAESDAKLIPMRDALTAPVALS